MSTLLKIVSARILLLLIVGAAAWATSRPACSECVSANLSLTLDDDRIVSARQYARIDRAGPLPAVVVVHGYLGSSGFMEVPWAEDLTRAGAIALFVDKVGHGWSEGSWWPESPALGENALGLDEQHPEIHAAIRHLRSQPSLIDATRIAVLGHSDGGTGAIIAASADWDIAATVAVSASAAPWEYVNHVAPRNLLLVYGSHDSFILEDTDRLLIKHATRGYLDDQGVIGSLPSGDARRLLRIPRRGHVDVMYDDAARRFVLEWLGESLSLDGAGIIVTSPLRNIWMISGIAALIGALSFWRGVPASVGGGEAVLQQLGKVAAIAVLWVTGLVVAGRISPHLEFVPVREGRTVIGLLAVCAAALAPVAFLRSWSLRPFSALARQAVIGVGVGLVVILVIELTLSPMYSMAYTSQRLALFALFLTAAIPSFGILCGAAAWVGNGSGQIVRGFPAEWVLAAITAVVGWWAFARMSILLALLLALALALVGAFRVGGAGVAAAAGMGGVVYSRLAGLVCAFY